MVPYPDGWTGNADDATDTVCDSGYTQTSVEYGYDPDEEDIPVEEDPFLRILKAKAGIIRDLYPIDREPP